MDIDRSRSILILCSSWQHRLTLLSLCCCREASPFESRFNHPSILVAQDRLAVLHSSPISPISHWLDSVFATKDSRWVLSKKSTNYKNYYEKYHHTIKENLTRWDSSTDTVPVNSRGIRSSLSFIAWMPIMICLLSRNCREVNGKRASQIDVNFITEAHFSIFSAQLRFTSSRECRLIVNTIISNYHIHSTEY